MGSTGPAGAVHGGASPSTAAIEWVDLGRFSISKTEVTVEQDRQCVEAGFCTAPDDSSVNPYCNWGQARREDHPINCVD